MPKKDKPIDWAGIERDYRDGRMSIREIARWYGNVTEGAIRKKAKAENWVRAERPHVETPKPLVGEIVEVRPAVKPEELPERARGIAARLLDELDAMTAHIGEIEHMIETEEGDSRRRQALLKLISTGERAKTLKDITAAMKTIEEARAPAGKKAARQEGAERAASGGKFGVPNGPRLAVDNSK
jgi:transposase